jgi:hypothetical protein
MITNLWRKINPEAPVDVPKFVAESLTAVNFTNAPVMSRKYNFIEFWLVSANEVFFAGVLFNLSSLSFRSGIEEYERSITGSAGSISESRPKSSMSLMSASRSVSPTQGTQHRSSSIDDRHSIRLAHKRVLSALKCNLVNFYLLFSFHILPILFFQICHFDAHISQFASNRIGNIAAKRDFDRMVSWHLLMQKLDKIATKATCSESKHASHTGTFVAQMYVYNIPHASLFLLNTKSQFCRKCFWRRNFPIRQSSSPCSTSKPNICDCC